MVVGPFSIGKTIKIQGLGKHNFSLCNLISEPSGYKSSAGRCAKVASKVETLDLPKRSPDLNPLDYGFWSEVNRRMRLQERGFSRVFRETRKQYIVRLRRTAMRMPKSFLAKLVQSMKRRCAALRAADGYDFEE